MFGARGGLSPLESGVRLDVLELPRYQQTTPLTGNTDAEASSSLRLEPVGSRDTWPLHANTSLTASRRASQPVNLPPPPVQPVPTRENAGHHPSLTLVNVAVSYGWQAMRGCPPQPLAEADLPLHPFNQQTLASVSSSRSLSRWRLSRARSFDSKYGNASSNRWTSVGSP